MRRCVSTATFRGRVYSVCYFDGEQGYYYMKRFQLEASEKMQSFLDEGAQVRFVAMTDRSGAKLVVTYQGGAGVASGGRDRRRQLRGREEPSCQGQAYHDV